MGANRVKVVQMFTVEVNCGKENVRGRMGADRGQWRGYGENRAAMPKVIQRRRTSKGLWLNRATEQS